MTFEFNWPSGFRGEDGVTGILITNKLTFLTLCILRVHFHDFLSSDDFTKNLLFKKIFQQIKPFNFNGLISNFDHSNTCSKMSMFKLVVNALRN